MTPPRQKQASMMVKHIPNCALVQPNPCPNGMEYMLQAYITPLISIIIVPAINAVVREKGLFIYL